MSTSKPTTTQSRHPWRATVRTAFAAAVGIAAAWGAIVGAAGVDQTEPVVATSLAVAAGVTRVMALPQVEQLLQRFLPWLAAAPKVGP